MEMIVARLEPLLQRPVEGSLGGFIERGGRFVEEQVVGFLEQRAGNGKALLFALR